MSINSNPVLQKNVIPSIFSNLTKIYRFFFHITTPSKITSDILIYVTSNPSQTKKNYATSSHQQQIFYATPSNKLKTWRRNKANTTITQRQERKPSQRKTGALHVAAVAHQNHLLPNNITPFLHFAKLQKKTLRFVLQPKLHLSVFVPNQLSCKIMKY